MQEKDLSRLHRHLVTLLIVLGIVLTAFAVITGLRFSGRDLLIRWGGTYSGSWERVYEDGSVHSIALPFEKSTIDRGMVSVQTRLPENIPGDAIFTVLDCRNIVISIDGQVRASFSNAENPLPGDNVKSVYLQVQLTPEDSGRLLRIDIDESTGDATLLNRIYYGNSLGTFECIFHSYGLQLVLATALAMFAAAIFIFGLCMASKYKTGGRIAIFGLAFFCLAAWLVLDNMLLQYLCGIYFVDGIWGYLLSMVMLIPMAGYLNMEQDHRYEILYIIVEALLLLDLLIMTTLHFTGIANFQETRPVMNLVLAFVVIVLVVTILMDAFYGHVKEYWEVCTGAAGLAVSAVLELVLINSVSGRLDGVYLLVGLYFMLVMMVIHISRQLREEKAGADEALRANRLKTEFLTNMSHEIRTPITAIMGMDELILSETDQPEISEYATNLRTAGRNLVSLVDDILDLSQVEEGRITLENKKYDAARVLSEVVNMEEIRAESKGLELRVSVDSFIPVYLMGDEKRMRQILVNLLNNAVKYTEKGYIQLSIYGSRTYNKVGITIRVEDTGVGIPEEKKQKLIDTFRAGSGDRRKFEGIGLGLPITASLVDLMHGRIYFDSMEGKGSVFTVEVEQQIAGDELIDDFQRRRRQYSRDEESHRELFTAPDARILVVDDNQMNITVVRGLLKRTAVRVDSVLSGKEMLAAVTKQHYDVILLDHMMPEMDGIEALKRSRELKDSLCLETPVVAMTANAIKGAREEYLHVGFDGYISKPLDIDRLEKLLMKLIPAELVHTAADGTAGNVSGEGSASAGQTPAPVHDGTVPVNVAEGMANCADDKAFYKEVLLVFVNEMPEKAAQLTGYFDSADIVNYRIVAHGLKSSARVIGASALSEEAHRLELAAGTGNTDYINDNHGRVIELYKQAADYVKEELLR